MGVVIHKLLHLFSPSVQERQPGERHLWVIVCDMAVNEHIDIRLLPEDCITVGRISEDFKENIPQLKSAEFYYGILSKNDE